ncbi:MAG TPA: FAD-dependent oxidoreductase [Geminicoccaceae bacterium]|nr:FAD-dependent oxidoreductase [Geminicoccaceae bacterium]
MEPGMVIVGAGQTGGRAALALRERGYPGPITLIGDEAAPPYERPSLSKAFLTGKADPADFTFATLEALGRACIEFRASATAERIDRARKEVVLTGGERVPYRKLLLATGRRVRRLPLDGPVGERVHYLRTLDDAHRLKDVLASGPEVVIIGGGFIGLEVASSAVELGCKVTVVELAPRLLSRAVPGPLAAMLEERHRAAGVEIVLGEGVTSIGEDEGRLAVHLAGGRTLAADVVLAGVGAVPRAELAEAAGLEVENGVVVDETLATSDPDIYAAGDVCAFPSTFGPLLRLEAWKNADVQGALAARNMLGAKETHREVPWFWSDQYELTLQMAGHPERGVRLVERPVEGGRLFFHLDEAGRLVGVSSLGPASLAKEAKLGQMLLERGLSPDPALLADPGQKLKALLR